jgi:hypothetical protein
VFECELQMYACVHAGMHAVPCVLRNITVCVCAIAIAAIVIVVGTKRYGNANQRTCDTTDKF